MRILGLLILALPAATHAQGWEAVYVRSVPVTTVTASPVYDPAGRFIGYLTEPVVVHPVAVPIPVLPARVVPADRPFVGTGPTFTRITPAPAVVTPALPGPAPGSFAAGFRMEPTYTIAPGAAPRGDISSARSLGVGLGGPRGGGFFMGYQGSRQSGNR